MTLPLAEPHDLITFTWYEGDEVVGKQSFDARQWERFSDLVDRLTPAAMEELPHTHLEAISLWELAGEHPDRQLTQEEQDNLYLVEDLALELHWRGLQRRDALLKTERRTLPPPAPSKRALALAQQKEQI
jgi:hypothetical protein